MPAAQRSQTITASEPLRPDAVFLCLSRFAAQVRMTRGSPRQRLSLPVIRRQNEQRYGSSSVSENRAGMKDSFPISLHRIPVHSRVVSGSERVLRCTALSPDVRDVCAVSLTSYSTVKHPRESRRKLRRGAARFHERVKLRVGQVVLCGQSEPRQNGLCLPFNLRTHAVTFAVFAAIT